METPQRVEETKQESQVIESQPVEAVEESPAPGYEATHAAMNWTACYDDNCLVHLGGKEGSGWLPRERPARRDDLWCFPCREQGHSERYCPKNPRVHAALSKSQCENTTCRFHHWRQDNEEDQSLSAKQEGDKEGDEEDHRLWAQQEEVAEYNDFCGYCRGLHDIEECERYAADRCWLEHP